MKTTAWQNYEALARYSSGQQKGAALGRGVSGVEPLHLRISVGLTIGRINSRRDPNACIRSYGGSRPQCMRMQLWAGQLPNYRQAVACSEHPERSYR